MTAFGEYSEYQEQPLTEHRVAWTTLRVQAFKSQGIVGAHETLPSHDQLIVVTTKGRGKVECFSNGLWRTASYYPGTGGMTPSGMTNRIRWKPIGGQVLETLHLFIPTVTFAGVEDEYRRVGMPFRGQPLNALSFHDPTMSQVARSVYEAARAGAPELYAQSAVQFLAVHLLSQQSGWSSLSEDTRRPGRLNSRRLSHVLEYMSCHYSMSLSLEQMAQEAGVSRFHFVRLFKEATGVTPHRYLIHIRMNAAASLLADTDRSISEIALDCGYQSAAHFSAAYQKHFHQSPRSFRLLKEK